MTRKSTLLLLDANIVIDAHKNNYWKPLCQAYRIVLPATILEEEVFYFRSLKGKKEPIKLSEDLSKGLVLRLEATVDQYKNLMNLLPARFQAGLDPGELEALALLKAYSLKMKFSSADRAAVKVLSLLGLSQNGVSVEELISPLGLKRRLSIEFSKKWFQQVVSEGFLEKSCL